METFFSSFSRAQKNELCSIPISGRPAMRLKNTQK